MIGIYLSGTGNTKHCVEKLLSIINEMEINKKADSST